MTKSDYISALKNGSEIVIVADDNNCNSSIFYLNNDGIVCTFSRFFGLVTRTDVSIDQAADHFKNMEIDCRVFVRG